MLIPPLVGCSWHPCMYHIAVQGKASTTENADTNFKAAARHPTPDLLLSRNCVSAANTTVLLDTSASLYALVLEGNLIFDDTAEDKLHLQVRT